MSYCNLGLSLANPSTHRNPETKPIIMLPAGFTSRPADKAVIPPISVAVCTSPKLNLRCIKTVDTKQPATLPVNAIIVLLNVNDLVYPFAGELEVR